MTIAFQTTNARPGRRLTLCAAIFCLITTTCWGVDDGIEGTEQLFGTWANLMVNGKFGKDSPWLYYGDVSLRTTETGRPFPPSGQGYQVSAVVTHDAIGYRFDEHNSVHVGYAFQYSAPPLAKQFTNENRAWEQYTYSTPTDLGNFQSRSRLEQRTVNIGTGTGVRLREMLKLSYPLNEKWSLIGSDEIFLNLNTVDWGPVAGLDQNRVFVGVGYKFDPVFRTEIGYMNLKTAVALANSD
jgi:hypothetical protein